MDPFMTALAAALSLQDKAQQYGSYAGIAAVIGLGVLSMLYFAQAREVKRLREWAGRSPERDAELAQRVQSDAQRRVVAQPRPAVQPGGPQTPAAQQADAARKAAALLETAGPAVGPPGQLARPASATVPAPGSVAAAGTAPAPGAVAAGGTVPAPGSVAAAAAAAAGSTA